MAPLIVGTRKSKLALTQTEQFCAALAAAVPDLTLRLETITTRGDVILDRPLSAIGDKGLFVLEFEQALRDGGIHAAVHSAKDLPATLPADMAIPCFPTRADPRDALLSNGGASLATLRDGARVGTSSLRRACLLRAIRPDLDLVDLRGNVDTRLRKLRDGQYDAIVLAAAGLHRLGLAHEIAEYLSADVMVPAVGQGVLAIEARAGDEATAQILVALDDAAARVAITAERAFLAEIGGGCQVPVGAHATLDGAALHLVGFIGARDGRMVRGDARGEHAGSTASAAQLGAGLARALLADGGRQLLTIAY